MITLNIFRNAETMGCGFSSATKVVEASKEMSIGLLKNGMASGKSSVSFLFELPDQTVVFAETSLNLFLQAATLFEAEARSFNPVPESNGEPGRLQLEFDRFALATFGDISRQQYIDLRRTFMGGVAALFGFLMRVPPEGTTTEDVSSLRAELYEFNEAVKRGEK